MVAGDRQRLGRIPRLANSTLRARCYAVVRDKDGLVLCGVAETWQQCQTAVGDPPDEASVFVGFPSQGEAVAFYEVFGAWQGESVSAPLRWLARA